MPKTQKQPDKLKTVHAHSAGGLVGTQVDGQPKLLLIKNTFDDRWAIPKGHIDPGETSEQAAVREIQEEAGIDSKLVELIGKNRYAFRHKNMLIRKVVDVYFLELVGSPELDPDKFDPHDQLVKDVRWFDPDTAVTAIGYKNLRDLVAVAAEKVKARYA